MARLAKIAFSLLLVLASSGFCLAQNIRLAFISGSEVSPFKEVFEGFHSAIEQEKDIVLINFSLNSSEIQDVENIRPDVIVTVGSKATDAVVSRFPKTPTISCLVIPLSKYLDKGNVTGVYFSPAPKEQLVYLGKFLPQTKVVGVLYSSDIGKTAIEHFRTAAVPLGFRLFSRQVEIPRDLPRALRMVNREADVLLGLPDTMIYSPHTARHILLASFRNRVPLVGISSHWVKAGALYCLQCDYRALGKQCASMSMRIRSGEKLSSVKPEHPKVFKPVINYRTANILDIKMTPYVTTDEVSDGKGNSE